MSIIKIFNIIQGFLYFYIFIFFLLIVGREVLRYYLSPDLDEQLVQEGLPCGVCDNQQCGLNKEPIMGLFAKMLKYYPSTTQIITVRYACEQTCSSFK